VPPGNKRPGYWYALDCILDNPGASVTDVVAAIYKKDPKAVPIDLKNRESFRSEKDEY
jgi:hypothetical protein